MGKNVFLVVLIGLLFIACGEDPFNKGQATGQSSSALSVNSIPTTDQGTLLVKAQSTYCPRTISVRISGSNFTLVNSQEITIALSEGIHIIDYTMTVKCAGANPEIHTNSKRTEINKGLQSIVVL